jgi:hypothetical protein
MSLRAFKISVFVFLTACSGSTGSPLETSDASQPANDPTNVPSSSGLPENAVVAQLSDGDLNQLCEWGQAYEGGAGPLGCDLTVNSTAQCTAGIRAVPTCGVTVAQYEQCAAALRADACTALGNPACGALAACSS